MKPLNEFKQELKSLIGKSEIRAAIKALKAELPNDSPFYTEGILFKVRLEKLEQSRRTGVISEEEEQRRYSTLIRDFLEIINSLEEKHFQPSEDGENISTVATFEKLEGTPDRIHAVREKVSLASSLKRKRLEAKLKQLTEEFDNLLDDIQVLNDSIKVEVNPITKKKFQQQINDKETALIEIEQTVEEIENEL